MTDSHGSHRMMVRDSWDFEGMRKTALTNLARSHISSFQTVRSRPRTSDRSKDSVTELIPEDELRQFQMGQSVLKNRFLAGMIQRRDLLMSILSTVLLFVSVLLFAGIQVIQSGDYNRLIPNKFYTKDYLQRNALQQRCLQAYILTMVAYIVTFNLSVRWKLEIDAEMELERLSKRELIRFDQ